MSARGFGKEGSSVMTAREPKGAGILQHGVLDGESVGGLQAILLHGLRVPLVVLVVRVDLLHLSLAAFR